MLERVGYVSHSAALELGLTERRLDAYQYCKRNDTGKTETPTRPVLKK